MQQQQTQRDTYPDLAAVGLAAASPPLTCKIYEDKLEHGACKAITLRDATKHSLHP